MVKHFQGSQNNKFAMSLCLQYLKKEIRNEADFLHPGKYQGPTSWFQHFRHQSFPQGDTIIIDKHDQAFSKYLT